MSYITSLHRMLYHIVVNILARTSGHKMNVTHNGLHLFYELLRGIQINLGAFTLKYMLLCEDDSTKGIAYGRILEGFSKAIVCRLIE